MVVAPWFEAALAEREVVRPSRGSLTQFAPYVMISPDERDELLAIAEAAQAFYERLVNTTEWLRLQGALTEGADSQESRPEADH